MTDNYEWAKSNMPQGVDTETPYESLNYSYVSDINNGVYANGSTTLLSFDLSSIYSSDKFIDMSKAFLTVPICYVAQWTSDNAGTVVAPEPNAFPLVGLKNGYFNLVHSCQLDVNGTTIEQNTPYLNSYVAYKLLSQASSDDYKGLGVSLGLGQELDTPQALRYSSLNVNAGAYGAVAGPFGGNGLTNNCPFTPATGANFGDQNAYGVQNSGSYNKGLFSRIERVVDLTNTNTNANLSLYGASGIAGVNQLNQEMRPTYTVSGNYMIWTDTAIIRMQDILNSMSVLPLARRFSGNLRLYLNTGTVGVSYRPNGTPTNLAGMCSSAQFNTFSNTCPLMISALQSQNTVVPATATYLTAGLFIVRATTTTINQVNLGASNASCQMQSCRLYFPLIKVKIAKSIAYEQENQHKQICYTAVLQNTISNISAGSQYSGLIQSGIKAIRGILILPFISSAVNGLLATNGAVGAMTGIVPFSPLISPFDPAPLSTGPIGIINLNVSIGSINVLQNVLSFNFENFIEQVSQYEKINSGDLGLSCGLISQYMWENAYRPYYFDCSRYTNADAITPRNINITFTNNSNVACDYLVFTEYFDSAVINVVSGLITKNGSGVGSP